MELKDIAPEIDALRQGMGWDGEDISRKQAMISSSFGDSHPGSAHLDALAKACDEGLKYAGIKPSHFTVTDICDGIAQGHEGMNYSLVSRDVISFMIEIHQKANVFDGMAVITSCDKSVPANLMALARLNIPSIFIPGGVMPSGGENFTLEQIGTVSVEYAKQKITKAQFAHKQSDACPSCGACQFMGTAATMQVMGEALGLTLPHAALVPANMKFAGNMAKKSGRTLAMLIDRQLTPSMILTKEALHNAIVIHSAIGGSTNALLHLPAIARECSLDFSIDWVDGIHRKVPFMLNTRPVGRFSTEMFWYAGGVPALMSQLKEHLYLDALTVTGKTLGENLEEYDHTQYYGYLQNYGLSTKDIICKLSDHGAIAILKGNIATEGAVVKHVGLPKSMRKFKGPARVFEDEFSARNAIIEKRIQPGDCIVIKYAGPKGMGMPEMFYTTQALVSDPELVDTTALITDGRFSGASKGPCIGHISPEAAEGGNIAFIRENDIIQIDIDNRTINALDVDFEQRKADWTPRPIKEKGVLGLYKSLAASAISGGFMQFGE